MTTTKGEKKTSTAFAWNEENTAKVIALYQKTIEDSGVQAANEQSSLLAIAKAVGAKSGSSVRSKLTSAGAYVKADTPHKVGGGSSIRKVHYVRAFVEHAKANGLEIENDALDSLESSKMDALKIVAKMIGVTVKAS